MSFHCKTTHLSSSSYLASIRKDLTEVSVTAISYLTFFFFFFQEAEGRQCQHKLAFWFLGCAFLNTKAAVLHFISKEEHFGLNYCGISQHKYNFPIFVSPLHLKWVSSSLNVFLCLFGKGKHSFNNNYVFHRAVGSTCNAELRCRWCSYDSAFCDPGLEPCTVETAQWVLLTHSATTNAV